MTAGQDAVTLKSPETAMTRDEAEEAIAALGRAIVALGHDRPDLKAAASEITDAIAGHGARRAGLDAACKQGASAGSELSAGRLLRRHPSRL